MNHDCTYCHQDLRDPPHAGVNGKDCPACGQGLDWVKLIKYVGYTQDEVNTARRIQRLVNNSTKYNTGFSTNVTVKDILKAMIKGF